MDAERLQEEAEQTEALRLANLQNDYQRVFLESGAGMRVLEDLFSATSPFQDTFYGNSRDIYLKGRRQIGLHIIDRLGMNTMRGLVKLMMRLSAIDPQAMADLAAESEAIKQFINNYKGKDNG